MNLIDVYFSLGTNIGDRQKNIETALALMDEAFGCHYQRLSTIIETEPWGFSSENFLNCAVLYSLPVQSDYENAALNILSKCKNIERAMGRQEIIEYGEDGKRIYHARVIDIDILFYGNHRISLEKLKVPHPLMKQRDFVMVPLNEIADEEVKYQFSDIFTDIID
ncbi:MAG: 2-amino-4-hydroxy-6-hydroxymethyldihydropteridine diphosphokinase [Bacteroidales bacterium]|nr:2-amino-4-hydroxy-6-hydroxymethyldihydropteridine diphosphokinase [Bacteroidales bacterium]